jgi:hypothetical protein
MATDYLPFSTCQEEPLSLYTSQIRPKANQWLMKTRFAMETAQQRRVEGKLYRNLATEQCLWGFTNKHLLSIFLEVKNEK